jgi:thiamine-phosphate pyrophosphorylase
LQEINDAVTIPVVAIGGINFHNAEDVLLHGADCLAVVSAIVCADNPCQAATNLATIIKKLRKSNHETE